ncbi:MAG: hypothetical protein ACI936_003395, partial [Paraglaciecola sp.]
MRHSFEVGVSFSGDKKGQFRLLITTMYKKLLR